MRFAPKTLRKTILALIAGLALVFVIGCGGSGGGGALGGLNVFITDDMSTGYDQVWVTIHEIEVQDSNGVFKTIFTSSGGVSVDLTSLTDGAPVFLYLGNTKIAPGDYTGMRVTMARGLTLVATASPTGEACTFDPAFNFGADKTRAAFSFGADVPLSGNDSLILDFDLANWNRVGSVVTPAFARGDDTTLGDSGRHRSEDYSGTVKSLSGTAPDQTFTLTRSNGSFQVLVDTNTIVYRENAAGNPALANNQSVEVRGTFDTASNNLLASVIKIEDGTDDDDHKVQGATSNLDSVAMTVDVAATEVDGFFPSGPTVIVQFSTDTRFFTKSGAPLTLDEMLVFLGTGTEVEAEGTYDSGTNTLTAQKIKLHPEDGDDNEAEARGAVSTINIIPGTFDMTLSSWFGFSASAGAIVHVTTSGSTTYRADNGDAMTANAFFTALQNGMFVEVEGQYDNGTIIAQKLKIEDDGGTPGQPEAKGYVSATNLGNGTFTIDLIEWFGFSGSFGSPQVIQTNGLTVFLDGDNNVMTQANFFAGLAIGNVVDAKGTFSGGILTATRARYRD